MKAYLEHLSKDETKKKEFETAINNAIDGIAKEHGFDVAGFKEKNYSNSRSMAPTGFTIQVGRTWVACCGS